MAIDYGNLIRTIGRANAEVVMTFLNEIRAINQEVVSIYQAIQNKNTFGNVGAGNYTEFESDGTIKFHGTASVFRDEMSELIKATKETPASKITTNIAEGSITYADNTTLLDYVIMSPQLNHDRKNGADIYPHLHWWQTSAEYPNWLIQYRWQQNGETKETAWNNLPGVTHAYTWTADTLNQITSFGEISPPAGDDVSDILQIRLIRDTLNDSGEFAAAESAPIAQDAVSLDAHIQIDTIGSRQEFVK